ncbi:hypothetical protein B0H13DRAFT_1883934 [Mycena leptocephala]|nr:hypothetical protein B0H13DRAFT_1883934 [Mycena leptocephala]
MCAYLVLEFHQFGLRFGVRMQALREILAGLDFLQPVSHRAGLCFWMSPPPDSRHRKPTKKSVAGARGLNRNLNASPLGTWRLFSTTVFLFLVYLRALLCSNGHVGREGGGGRATSVIEFKRMHSTPPSQVLTRNTDLDYLDLLYIIHRTDLNNAELRGSSTERIPFGTLAIETFDFKTRAGMDNTKFQLTPYNFAAN